MSACVWLPLSDKRLCYHFIPDLGETAITPDLALEKINEVIVRLCL